MSRGTPGNPCNCKKRMKYNWSFTNNPLSKRDLNRIRRVQKKIRAKNRTGNVQGYKINKEGYTGYRKVCKMVEWQQSKSRHLKFYINPLTNQLKYSNTKPGPIKQWSYESIAEMANITHVVYTKMRPLESIEKV